MTNSKLLFTQNINIETITLDSEKVFIVDEVYSILENAYRDVKGGLHFQSCDDLLLNTAMWKVIYSDTTIVGVIIYKAKQGLKMVAMGLSSNLKRSYNNIVKQTLVHLFKLTFSYTWMELSEGAEKFILKHGGSKYILPNHLAKELTKKEIIELCDDGVHYKRVIKGVVKTKIIVGNPKLV